ncbi:hypothetical protein ANCCEY_05365 [Ancylostoma ceylanicum]|uniref:Uncharacterized protein n=1 Tax=Ancylostoma ceylanicum TaxID=53326 RepID=A0A0D6LWH3_9BILA|nr:hypothetical protein ANCCEY_05365 [Ancylostoma ceylanicum]
MAPNTQREKDTATARTTEKNQERAQLWEEITRQINDTFSGKLEALSVEKTKKLLTYYKKKEDGSYDKIKYPSQSSLDEYPTDGDFDSTDPPSGCESDASEHGGFECDWFVTDSAINAAETDQRLRKSRGSSSCDLSVVKSESPPSTVFCDAAYNLKKERHDFVVSTAEHYLERMCFDSSSRSAQVNAERHNMWVKITHLTNEKYGNVLSPLAVEQAKKLFSNCKRRRRMRIESTSTAVSFDPSNANDANSTMDIVPTLDSFSTQVDDSPSHQFQNLMHGLDLSVEIGELRRQLAERDAEVARLQRIIVEKPEVKRTVAGRPVPIASKSDETSVDRTSVQSKTPTRTKIEGLSPFLREEPRSDVDDTLDQVQSLEMERSEKQKSKFKWLNSFQSSIAKKGKTAGVKRSERSAR